MVSVAESDYEEILSVGKRFYDLGIDLYATTGTAKSIAKLGIPVTHVENGAESVTALIESGKINYIIYTGAIHDATVGDYNRIHRRAMQLGIPCLTSLDTAGALAEIIESRFTKENTELVNINDMRTAHRKIPFAKMQSCGNDYIFVENFHGEITCPESLCVGLCAPHYGVGADGIVLIEASKVADAKMRSFNRDGSEGKMAGNNIRCVGKYLYDKGIVKREEMTVETPSGVYSLKLFLRDGKVGTVSVNMGKAVLEAKEIPVKTPLGKVVNESVRIADADWKITCVSVGNPHCVVFCDALDALDLSAIGPKFEHDPLFPERVNTEFVRVVDRTTLRMRAWERGNGETLACGTGACAAVVAACENGQCARGVDIRVKLAGGDLIVNNTDGTLTLTGPAVLVYEGIFEY